MRGARAKGDRTPEPGLRVYGVLSAGHADARPARSSRPAGLAAVELLRVRDLVAAVGPAPFAAAAPTEAELAATHAVVSALFAERAILPAPPGAVFRTRAAVAAWLELHAAALAEALRYVEDRVAARVHVERSGVGTLPGAAVGAPLPEVLRALRREAVSLLVLRDAGPAGGAHAERHEDAAEVAAAEPEARAAFLVERGHWGAFAAAVAREQDARPDLRLALTGPWPPYDFVRLDLCA